MPAQKIATCCYCGTRAALVLAGDKRHELACSSCGAPLHNLKIMPTAKTKPAVHKAAPKTKIKKQKKRKKKSLFKEIFDIVEDIID